MTDVYVYQMDMGRNVHDAIAPGWEDDCTIRKLEAIDHAFWHMRNEDFLKDDVQQIEAEAHRRK